MYICIYIHVYKYIYMCVYSNTESFTERPLMNRLSSFINLCCINPCFFSSILCNIDTVRGTVVVQKPDRVNNKTPIHYRRRHRVNKEMALQ